MRPFRLVLFLRAIYIDCVLPELARQVYGLNIRMPRTFRNPALVTGFDALHLETPQGCISE